MISLDNIYSFTDFQRNAKSYATQIRESKEPVVLTINGEAALVVQEARAFQEILNRLQKAEEELRQIKPTFRTSSCSTKEHRGICLWRQR